MTKQEATKILAVLAAAYPNAYRRMGDDETKGVIALWALQFAKIPADIVFMALNKAISKSEYPPTIAEVKRQLEALSWEALEAIRMHEHTPYLSETALAEYRRIYRVAKEYRFTDAAPSLGDMMATNSNRYLTD